MGAGFCRPATRGRCSRRRSDRSSTWPPGGRDRKAATRLLDLINKLNAHHLAARGDDTELTARIQATSWLTGCKRLRPKL